MKQGKIGIAFPILAGMMFVLALDRQVIGCVVLICFIFWAEQDNWVHRQSLQAVFLVLVNAFVFQLNALGWATGELLKVQNLLHMIWKTLYVGLVIFATVRVLLGKDAALPLLSGLAYKATGVAKPKITIPVQPYHRPYPTGSSASYPNAPQQPYPGTPPHVYQNAPPQSYPNTPPQPSPDAAPAAPPAWQCNCGAANIGRFCSVCGQPKAPLPTADQVGG